MSRYLLDTNVVSEFRKRERADRHVRHWLAAHGDDDFWLSALVIGELSRGVMLLHRRDPRQASSLKRWLSGIRADYADRILPITVAICERWAELSVPNQLPVIDGLLAATAMEHELIFVTRNTADVASTGVACVNPFRPQ